MIKGGHLMENVKCYNCPYEIACCPKRYQDMSCCTCLFWEDIVCNGCYYLEKCTISKGVDLDSTSTGYN